MIQTFSVKRSTSFTLWLILAMEVGLFTNLAQTWESVRGCEEVEFSIQSAEQVPRPRTMERDSHRRGVKYCS